jgi:toxin-antitoxin system PIN domain toxin
VLVVDTNVLIYAVNRSAPEHERCRTKLAEWSAGATPWYLTWGIIYELLRVATHPRVFARPLTVVKAWAFVGGLLASPSIGLLVETARHPAVVSQLVREVPGLHGNLLHDAHTAALMREHGVRSIVTRDLGFHRFPFLEVIDPLS